MADAVADKHAASRAAACISEKRVQIRADRSSDRDVEVNEMGMAA